MTIAINPHYRTRFIKITPLYRPGRDKLGRTFVFPFVLMNCVGVFWLLLVFSGCCWCVVQANTTRVGGMLCCGGEKVESEAHFRGELQKFLSDVSCLLQRALSLMTTDV